MIAKGNHRHHRSSGFVLLVVLGLIIVLSLLIGQFSREVLTDIHYRSQVYGDPELKNTAYDALEISLAVLQEINVREKGLFSPRQGWNDPLSYANISFPSETNVRVQILDETGKIPLSDKRCLEALGETVGLSSSEAASLVQDLQNWSQRKSLPATLEIFPKTVESAENAPSRSPVNRATKQSNTPSTNENTLPRPYVFSTRLQAYEDLRQFPRLDKIFNGHPTPDVGHHRLERFIAGTSLFHNGPINLNTANDDVLEALSKVYSLNAKEIKAYLNETPSAEATYYRSLRQINQRGHGSLKLSSSKLETAKATRKPIQTRPAIDVKCHRLRVEIEARRGDVRFRLTALLNVLNQDNPSLKNLTSNQKSNHISPSFAPCIKVIGLTEQGRVVF
jgi:type II secretory pathway component PulK